MNMAIISKYSKIVLYVVVLIIIGGIGINIVSTYKENVSLKETNVANSTTIKSLQSDIKEKDDVNTALKTRIAEIQIVEKKTIVYVDKIKKEDNTFISKTKEQAKIIKKETPNKLDEFYTNKYNSILDCISDITKDGDTICSGK